MEDRRCSPVLFRPSTVIMWYVRLNGVCRVTRRTRQVGLSVQHMNSMRLEEVEASAARCTAMCIEERLRLLEAVHVHLHRRPVRFGGLQGTPTPRGGTPMYGAPPF